MSCCAADESCKAGLVSASSSHTSTHTHTPPDSNEHYTYLRHVLDMKESLADRPRQTGFRVMALITYYPLPARDATGAHPYDQHLRHPNHTDHAYVLGTNTELCFIGSGMFEL